MKALKTTGIVALFIGISVIIYFIIRNMLRDDKINNNNITIKQNAIKLGIPESVATKIAIAEDSSKAAQTVGISLGIAKIIANDNIDNYTKTQLYALQGLPLDINEGFIENNIINNDRINKLNIDIDNFINKLYDENIILSASQNNLAFYISNNDINNQNITNLLIKESQYKIENYTNIINRLKLELQNIK